MEGRKEIFGLWIGETDGKHVWIQIFDELETRGVKDILLMSSDCIVGMEDGATVIFPENIFQKCIVPLIRSSLKYVPSKDYKAFIKDLKKFYGVTTFKSAETAF